MRRKECACDVCALRSFLTIAEKVPLRVGTVRGAQLPINIGCDLWSPRVSLVRGVGVYFVWAEERVSL